MEGESFVEDVVPESGADTLKRITVSVLQGAEDTSENRLCLRSGSFRIRRRASVSEVDARAGVLRKPIWMPPLSGQKGGQNRNNPAGQGDETHELVEEHGIPLAVYIAGANVSEVSWQFPR